MTKTKRKTKEEIQAAEEQQAGQAQTPAWGSASARPQVVEEAKKEVKKKKESDRKREEKSANKKKLESLQEKQLLKAEDQKQLTERLEVLQLRLWEKKEQAVDEEIAQKKKAIADVERQIEEEMMKEKNVKSSMRKPLPNPRGTVASVAGASSSWLGNVQHTLQQREAKATKKGSDSSSKVSVEDKGGGAEPVPRL